MAAQGQGHGPVLPASGSPEAACRVCKRPLWAAFGSPDSVWGGEEVGGIGWGLEKDVGGGEGCEGGLRSEQVHGGQGSTTVKRIPERMFSLKELREKAHSNLGMGAGVATSLPT